jgi:MFS family permease
MTDATTIPRSTNIFDGWRSISIALYMALVGYSVMVSIPVLNTAWVKLLGFSEMQVGWVSSADLLGSAIGAVLTALLVTRINRQTLVIVGIIVSISGNALCMQFVEYEQVLWLRVLSGFGSGIFTSIAVVTLAGTTNPARAFNMLLFAFAFSTALELHVLPQLSMNGIYLFFIGLTTTCAVFLRWIPARALTTEEQEQYEREPASEVQAPSKLRDLLEKDNMQFVVKRLRQLVGEAKSENWHVPRFLPVICLCAVGFTYINIGGYFAYIELAAVADGVAQEWMTPVLTSSSIFAIIGCGLALVCMRFGLFKPLFASLVVMTAIATMPSVGINKWNIVVSLFGFMTLWTFVDIYQSAMLAHMDRKGSLVALLPGVQYFGQFLGPFGGAWILQAGLGYSVMFVVSGSMALVALFLYVGVSVYMHNRPPTPMLTSDEVSETASSVT